jgi:tetratricopeptide (TPR) repeat protein
MGQFDEAANSYRRALADNSNFDARINLGVLLKDLGKLDEALIQYDQVLEFDPENRSAHNKKSTTLLLLGELEKGWLEYEWRWKRTSEPLIQRNFPQPRWNGESLKGKSILIWGEQGLGDEISFSSMVPDLVSLSAHCTLECEPRLVDLFARSFPETQVRARPYTEAENGTDEFDFQLPTGSLFAQFRNSITDFPDRKGFLVVDAERKEKWQGRLSALDSGLKVGISWRSGVWFDSRGQCYADITDLEPLFSLKNVVFINLQYDDCTDELSEIQKLYGITLHTWDDIDMKNDLDDATALISCLDVVITCQNAVYSLSCGAGLITFAFGLRFRDWDSLGTDGVPYYPTARLFERHIGESWGRVFSEITDQTYKMAEDKYLK